MVNTLNVMKIDKGICPLCHQDNGCMANSGKNCWCVDVVVPKSLLELVPVSQRGEVCICRTCIERYGTD